MYGAVTAAPTATTFATLPVKTAPGSVPGAIVTVGVQPNVPSVPDAATVDTGTPRNWSSFAWHVRPDAKTKRR